MNIYEPHPENIEFITELFLTKVLPITFIIFIGVLLIWIILEILDRRKIK